MVSLRFDLLQNFVVKNCFVMLMFNGTAHFKNVNNYLNTKHTQRHLLVQVLIYI